MTKITLEELKRNLMDCAGDQDKIAQVVDSALLAMGILHVEFDRLEMAYAITPLLKEVTQPNAGWLSGKC